MSSSRRTARPSRRLVVVTTAFALFAAGLEGGLIVGTRAYVDHRQEVSDLRLTAAMKTFRPAPHAGLAKPLEADAFISDRNPRATPSTCAPLTALATGPARGGRSWTGAGNGSPAAVTLLTVRFADADAARAELARKRWAMLRCRHVDVTFPPFDEPPVAYTVAGRHWATSSVGRRARWTLDGGGRTYSFYVERYGNSLTWTYDDDEISTPQDRAQVAADLIEELRGLAGR